MMKRSCDTHTVVPSQRAAGHHPSNTNRWDSISKMRGLSDAELEDWADAKKTLLECGKRERSDLAQKARVRWAIDGDDNSRFFHGLFRPMCAVGRINGLLIDGVWVNDPEKVMKINVGRTS
ncbi:hypothetical protein SSX86_008311 [Deinandra increscens subsp. villosa]|uniref:Uncharacterized protein n=1 Tax=Deinandra increscens subsp. villosa TaxID=3103831 RepID=A0AAP0H4E6_9ASTR